MTRMSTVEKLAQERLKWCEKLLTYVISKQEEVGNFKVVKLSVSNQNRREQKIVLFELVTLYSNNITK